MNFSRLWYNRDGRPRTASPTVLFLAIVVLASLFVLMLTTWKALILPPIDVLTARLLGVILSVAGVDLAVNLKTISMMVGTTEKSMIIGYGCDGVLAYLILASAIIPFPSNLRSRVAGLFLGLIFVIIMNQLRLCGLVVVMFLKTDIEDFRYYHTTVGQIFALVMIFVFWQGWATWVLRRPKATIASGGQST
jgi:exosortase/archaeosortase family protein